MVSLGVKDMTHRAFRIGFGTLTAAALLPLCALGAAKEFDFKDPKGVNTMTFTLDSTVEPISGLASGISGKLSFDPADARKLSGKLVVDAKSIRTQNDNMTKALHGEDWLDIEENPTVEFNIKEVKSAKPAGDNAWELELAGEFSCNGQKKDMTIPARATYLPGRMKDRMRGRDGDLLVLRSTFKINRKDFKIKEDMDGTLVAQEIEIRANIVGSAPKE